MDQVSPIPSPADHPTERPGYQTTEFYVVLGVIAILGAALLMQVYQGKAVDFAAFVGLAGTASAYAGSRAITKSSSPQ